MSSGQTDGDKKRNPKQATNLFPNAQAKQAIKSRTQTPNPNQPKGCFSVAFMKLKTHKKQTFGAAGNPNQPKKRLHERKPALQPLRSSRHSPGGGCTFKPEIDQRSAEMISQRLARLKITGTLCQRVLFFWGLFGWFGVFLICSFWKETGLFLDCFPPCCFSPPRRYESLYEDAVRRRERHLESMRAPWTEGWRGR